MVEDDNEQHWPDTEEKTAEKNEKDDDANDDENAQALRLDDAPSTLGGKI